MEWRGRLLAASPGCRATPVAKSLISGYCLRASAGPLSLGRAHATSPCWLPDNALLRLGGVYNHIPSGFSSACGNTAGRRCCGRPRGIRRTGPLFWKTSSVPPLGAGSMYSTPTGRRLGWCTKAQGRPDSRRIRHTRCNIVGTKVFEKKNLKTKVLLNSCPKSPVPSVSQYCPSQPRKLAWSQCRCTNRGRRGNPASRGPDARRWSGHACNVSANGSTSHQVALQRAQPVPTGLRAGQEAPHLPDPTD